MPAEAPIHHRTRNGRWTDGTSIQIDPAWYDAPCCPYCGAAFRQAAPVSPNHTTRTMACGTLLIWFYGRTYVSHDVECLRRLVGLQRARIRELQMRLGEPQAAPGRHTPPDAAR